MAQNKQLKVAIVHDWLVGGGAELVVEQLHKLYPAAPIYTSYASQAWRKRLDHKVVTGYLGWEIFGKLRKFLPVLRILWFENLNLQAYDLVISSSGAEAKGIKNLRKDTVHINYCHAPTHYYWKRYDQYIDNPGFGVFNPLAKIGLRLLVSPLRKWDYTAAQRPDEMIANSTYIQSQIKTYYGRDVSVIHPPVRTEHFMPTNKIKKGNNFVVVGRQTPYKRIDLAVAACTELNLPLSVYGNGPDHQNLKQLAGPTVTFYTDANDKLIAKALQEARGFIFTSEDDFGIAPVEALAAGTPVISYASGGSTDYVIDGKTGIFFREQTVDSLQSSLQKFEEYSFKKTDLINQAETFAPEVFRAKMMTLVSERIEL